LLGFYLDSQLTIPASLDEPKKFLVPLKGGTKTTTVYVGDPYSTFLADAASIGATSIALDDTTEFLPTGQATVGVQTISYTGISAGALTGVTGLAAAATVGSKVQPLKMWIGTGQNVFYSQGADKDTLRISMRPSGSGPFNYPGMPLILAASDINVGPSALAIDLQIAVPIGAITIYSNWSITTSAFFQRRIGDTTAPTPTEIGTTLSLNGYVLQRDQQLGLRLRLLPQNRAIAENPPGFVWGTYRWRDEAQVNQHALIPSSWNVDPVTVGAEKFIAGVGAKDDLAPTAIIQENDSIYLQVKRGHYFTGINRYYLPATPQLDFLDANNLTVQLSQRPTPTLPIFLGTYQLDSQGYYETGRNYRYQTVEAIARGINLPPFWYTLDRVTNVATLSATLPNSNIFLGALSGQSIDYFEIPIYPVGQVLQVYTQAAAGTSAITATNWVYDPDAGTLVITSPTGAGASITGGAEGMSVFATCTPALAALYETGTEETLTLDTVDLNPAFAGLAGGYVYLEQRKQIAAALVLSADKPLIPIPATLSSIIGLVAYGPVYFNGDYSLLQVIAYSDVAGEIVSNVRLKVIVDPETFTGRLNYQDPLTTPLEVITGADGIANLIFTPDPNYGLFVPNIPAAGALGGLATTTVTNDTVVLPEAVPISQIWNATDGWFVDLYTVVNNNPVYGKVGADVGAGEVLFVTSGTPGSPNYRTNGAKDVFLSSNKILTPIKAFDSSGNNYTDSGFNGNVVSLVYAQGMISDSIVAAYFITFIQRTIIQLQEVDSDVLSNSIMLEIGPSPVIDDSIYLILNDSAHGILNQYRLGGPSH
jgi:hypothetical protein